DAVGVRILKGARVDLVDHTRLPPGNAERGRQPRRPYCGACRPGDESHSFTREAVAAWRAFLIVASRSRPGASSFASSVRRTASSIRWSCNGALGRLRWMRDMSALRNGREHNTLSHRW